MTPRKEPKPYVPFNALLPVEMHRELRIRSAETGMSASEIVREALRVYLKAMPKRRAR
jgi:plasmid stability protein